MEDSVGNSGFYCNHGFNLCGGQMDKKTRDEKKILIYSMVMLAIAVGIVAAMMWMLSRS